MNQDAELIACCDAATACVDAYNAAVEAEADEATLSKLFRDERGAFARMSTTFPTGITDAERIELDRAVFAIAHVAEMAENLNRAYLACFDDAA